MLIMTTIDEILNGVIVLSLAKRNSAGIFLKLRKLVFHIQNILVLVMFAQYLSL